MLIKSASFVLDSSKSSTYPRGYAYGFDSPAALLTAILSTRQCSAAPKWMFLSLLEL